MELPIKFTAFDCLHSLSVIPSQWMHNIKEPLTEESIDKRVPNFRKLAGDEKRFNHYVKPLALESFHSLGAIQSDRNVGYNDVGTDLDRQFVNNNFESFIRDSDLDLESPFLSAQSTDIRTEKLRLPLSDNVIRGRYLRRMIGTKVSARPRQYAIYANSRCSMRGFEYRR